jgi:hypothetical protein
MLHSKCYADRMQHKKQVTVVQAAASLGVSVDTIRRRVRSGDLEKVQLERGYAVVLEEPSADEHLIQQVLAERDRLIEQVGFLERQLEEAAKREEALLKLLDSSTRRGDS